MRKVFIDGGANVGQSIIAFCNNFPDASEYEIICFEASHSPMVLNPLNDVMQQYQSKAKSIKLNNKALWIYDGVVSFYDKGTESSSILHRAQFVNNPNVVKRNVECIDLSNWIKNTFTKDDYVVLKLDIEGGEYDIIKKMYDDKTIGCVDRFYCEIHGIKCKKNYKESLNLIKMVEESGTPFYTWTAESYAEQGDRRYTKDFLKYDFINFYKNLIDLHLRTHGPLPHDIHPEMLLKAVSDMIESEHSLAMYSSLCSKENDYIIRLEGKGLRVVPYNELTPALFSELTNGLKGTIKK